ncbi:hypothetical protein DFJ58DRAFT_847560 [Suillus subalutaceus]|uniref:uncharacterized protein n=1 Tax=Suillus subalutaceus TaxID=48586 RepID=UPI001B85D2D8|nr:uncharacterized protein DFJ58DRAFT_847560 [Suillus subalutaceus]KAG1834667.1 hypothetical protein DFJ58DRAFT_847560 [Suillus subalutaceus]
MPSSDVSNQALGHAAAEVVQILARALQWKKGCAGHLFMVMEMANIMYLPSMGQAATKISLVLLSAAMELMEYWDPIGCTSFVTMPVWKNIVMGTQFCDPGSTIYTPINSPIAYSHRRSAGAIARHIIKAKPVLRKKKVDLNLASDGIEIDRVVADVTSTSDGKQKGKIVPSEELESDMSMDRSLTNVILKADVKGKSWQKRPRDASGSRPPVKQTVTSSLPDDATPPMEALLPVAETAIIGKKHKSGHQQSMSIDQQEGMAKHGVSNAKDAALTEDITASRKVQGQSLSRHVPHVSINMLVPDTNGAGQAAPPALSVPPIATLSLVLPSMPPARNQMGTWAAEIRHSAIAEELEMDVSGDAVMKELHAMTLEVKENSVSLLEKNEDLQASINALKMEVAVLKGCNTAATELLEAMKVRLAAHDTDIQTLDGMRTELAALQEDVKAVQAESRTREEQLQAAEAKLALQSCTTAVLQDAYEALWQHVVSNLRYILQPRFYTGSGPGNGMNALELHSRNSGLNDVAGSSNQATGSSEAGQVFSELASGMGPN